MTNEQLFEKIKEYVNNKYYPIMRELNFIHERLVLNGDDSVAIADLQRQLNEERAKDREKEIEQYIEQHPNIIRK